MTDLATKPTSSGDEPAAGTPTVEWVMPPEAPRRSRRRLWLGIGIPAAALVAASGLAVASTFFIAPGTTALGVDVGLSTAASAEDAVAQHIAETPIEVTAGGATSTFTGAELGLAADAGQVAADTLAEYPLWKIGSWSPGSVDADLAVDTTVTAAALEEAFPDAYAAPVNADLSFADGAYTVVADEPGLGIDVDALAAEVAGELSRSQDVQALAAGAGQAPAADATIRVEAQVVEQAAAFTAADAEAAAASLNDTIAGVEFTLDGDVVDAAPADRVASWLTVSVSDAGDVAVAADADAIQAYVDELPEKVDQKPVDAEVVTNAAGDPLLAKVEGQDGYQISSTEGIGAELAGSLEALEAQPVALAGEKVAHETTEMFRRAVVNKGEGMAYFYETIDGGDERLVKSFPIAIGREGYDTQVGEFTVYGQLTIQNMGSCDADGNFVEGGAFDYCTPDVPYPTYFNGDQGFHGTYWHDNFGAGARMSHGCVNLTVSASEWVYSFLQVGSPVSVRA
ncbi:L,D-transpeptidase family protein [Microbacterium excoecariae]|uniref:L,D-transpeptidase family protein n=1 Tax=Microbacterium excoecariae TaxID=2715210 RepID=UPI0014077BBA|nr:L,D-transpeptidase family protein [Microbacterium excoecariae]NHI17612.1 L,D-transpeptidase family protein [Microbacterium excoecariae]